MKLLLLGLIFQFFSQNVFSNYSPDWSEDATLGAEGNRENIYQLPEKEFHKKRHAGLIHALKYPVSVTGLLIPYRPMQNVLSARDDNPIRQILFELGRNFSEFRTEGELYSWLGLPSYPEEDEIGIYKIPYPQHFRPEYGMGASVHFTRDGKLLTFSCAACHSSEFFGKSVMGLPNKQTRANEFFIKGKKLATQIPTKLFELAAGANRGETKVFHQAKKNLESVGVVKPQVLGLDTSLAQVALSLARRNQDPYATKNREFEVRPRKNELEHFVADSKPGVWWNLKYKTRWLLDGSIISGNPIHTNFLWNEIGRGTDLKALEKWMQDNQKTIEELTVAAFSTKPIHWTDFFPAHSISLTSAKRGQVIFNNTCKKCHGVYHKNWDLSADHDFDEESILKTYKVEYFDKTPVKNVGTDPQRAEGMKYFAADLNNLAISNWMKTKVVPQEGYVPPPLEGIWARYPYFHNNSIPNLCALLTPVSKRPTTFYQGPSRDLNTDYDEECVGYPTGNDIPKEWRDDPDRLFDTTKPGLSNRGHAKYLFDDNGEERFTKQDKKDLIEFLKTL